jgi:predicted component of viral defense system (DUF524 family)
MRPLHRIVLAWSESHTIEIEWDGGLEGERVEPPEHAYLQEASLEQQLDTFGVFGTPPICWRESEDGVFAPLQLRENTEYLVDVTLPCDLDAAKAKWVLDNAWPLMTIRNAYKSDPPKRWRKEGGRLVVTGRLNFRSYVGAAQLSLPMMPAATVEVACTKISYFDDFRTLLDAIADEYASLLFEVESPTFAHFSVSDVTEPQLMTFLFLLRHAMEETRLPSAVEAILNSPRSALVQTERSVPLGQQRDPLPADFLQKLPEGTLQPGGPLASLFREYTPMSVPERVKRETFDTPENRYVKSFLENLRDSADDLTIILREKQKTAIAQQVDEWGGRLSDWLQSPLWADVKRMSHFPSNSQILQKAAAYREVLSTDLRIQLGLALPWDAGSSLESDVNGDLRPISQLYEYWCFFFLRSILRHLCSKELPGGNLIRVTDHGLSVVLQRGTESRVIFRYEDEEGRSARISLFYNRKFARSPKGSTTWSGSYSAIFNPDFSIMIDVIADPESDRVHWLHFDAKYRLDVRLWEAELEKDVELFDEPATNNEDLRTSATYKRNDLFKMHTYRDALLGSRGSYVLFPGAGDKESVFIRYPGVEYSEGSIRIPSVGAFQASPKNQQQQALQIESFIVECVQRLVATTGYQEELGILGTDEL